MLQLLLLLAIRRYLVHRVYMDIISIAYNYKQRNIIICNTYVANYYLIIQNFGFIYIRQEILTESNDEQQSTNNRDGDNPPGRSTGGLCGR